MVSTYCVYPRSLLHNCCENLRCYKTENGCCSIGGASLLVTVLSSWNIIVLYCCCWLLNLCKHNIDNSYTYQWHICFMKHLLFYCSAVCWFRYGVFAWNFSRVQELSKSSVICWQHIVLTGAMPVCFNERWSHDSGLGDIFFLIFVSYKVHVQSHWVDRIKQKCFSHQNCLSETSTFWENNKQIKSSNWITWISF